MIRVKNFQRKLVSITLAAVMVVAMLPLSVIAAEGDDISITWHAERGATADQGTVKLTASIYSEKIQSAEVYLELTEGAWSALDRTSLPTGLSVATQLPPEKTQEPPESTDTDGIEGMEVLENPDELKDLEQPDETEDLENPDEPKDPANPDSEDSKEDQIGGEKENQQDGVSAGADQTGGKNEQPGSEGDQTNITPGTNEYEQEKADATETVVTTEEESKIPAEPSDETIETPTSEPSEVQTEPEAGETLSVEAVSYSNGTEDGTDDSEGTTETIETPETTETTVTPEQTRTPGRYLSFTLTQGENFEAELTFTLPDDMDALTISVSKHDIHIRSVTYNTTEGTPMEALKVGLDANALTLEPQPKYGLSASGNTQEIVEGAEALKNFDFTFFAVPPESGTETYDFSLTLPKGITLPDGELTTSENGLTILAGGTQVVKLDFLTPSGVAAAITDPAVTGQSLDFTLTLSTDAASQEGLAAVVRTLSETFSGSDVSGRITFYGPAFSMDYNTLFGAGSTDKYISLTVRPLEGETITAGITLTPPDVEKKYDQGTMKDYTQTVKWNDNNDAAGKRPDYGTEAGEFYPAINYTIKQDGREISKGTLNETSLVELGFVDKNGVPEWPAITKTDTGFSISLPATLYGPKDPYGNRETYQIEWEFEAPEVEGYRLDGSANSWTYTQIDDFTFTLDMKRGNPGKLTTDQVMDILSQFQLQGQTNRTGEEHQPLEPQTFSELKEKLEIEPTGGDTCTITIPGLDSFNGDGDPLVYWVAQTDEGEEPQGDGKITYIELGDSADTLLPEGQSDGDYFAIAYNNAGVDDAGGSTSAAYSGGTLSLTLTGTTQYQATKIWLDSGDEDHRPEAEFELWRYPQGSSYTTASQIRWVDVVPGGDNSFIIVDGDALAPATEETPSAGGQEPLTGEGSEGDETPTQPEVTQAEAYTIEFKYEDNYGDNSLTLPKYNQDGYRYIYGVREYLEREDGDYYYEQVFGKVDLDSNKIEDGSDERPYEGDRGGDTLVYNGGTLSNRLTDEATARVTKIWEAAAYQAAFEDVAVVFTLEQRVKTDPAGGNDDFFTAAAWETVKDKDGNDVTYILHNFSAERMRDTGAMSGLPLYDAQGRELEYRWVETAVYQGVEIAANATQTEAKTALASLSPCKKTTADGVTTFTLNQAAEEEDTPHAVRYRSIVSDDSVSGNTIITNTAEDTVDFALEKQWVDITPTDVTLNIYQTPAGTDFDFAKDPYVSVEIKVDNAGKVATVTLDKKGHEGVEIDADDTNSTAEGSFNNLNGITEKTDWDAIVQNLPQYDEDGRLYSYIVMEGKAESEESFAPTFINKYYEETGDYSSVVINGPGDGYRIMVQKNWVDGGDMLHRQPVTFGVYYKDESGKLQPVLNKVGGSTTHVTMTIDGSQTGTWTDFIYFSKPVDQNGNEIIDGFTGADISRFYVVELDVGDYEVNHGHGGTEGDNIPTADEWEAGRYSVVEGAAQNIFEVSTNYHRYQVTYERKLEGDPAVPANVDALYTVTNRRLGAVDVSVTKDWVSGEDADGNEGVQEIAAALQDINGDGTGTQLALAFQLTFAEEQEMGEGWEITTGGTDGNTVSVGGEAVQITNAIGEPMPSIQIILGPGHYTWPEEWIYKFYSLPKYDAEGVVVQYQVREVWVQRNSETDSWEPLESGLAGLTDGKYDDLKAIWSEYAATYQESYTVSTDPQAGVTVQTDVNLRDRDTQKIAVTNRRGVNKDVTWYKEWRDHYADEGGNRPDVYLDIYSVVQDKEGKPQIQLVQKNYRWQVHKPAQTVTTTQTMEVPATELTLAANGITALSADSAPETVPMQVQVTETTNQQNDIWSVTIQDLPKYDNYGYEIRYFAVERTEVHVSAFDYQAVQYAYDTGTDGTAANEGPDTTILGNRDGEGRPEGSMFDDYTLDLGGSIAWANEDDKPDNIGHFNNNENPSNTYPRYALLEEGTFINTLDNTFSVTGEKLWDNLPSGFLSNPDLPTVRFDVYRFTDEKQILAVTDERLKDYWAATLTITPEDWGHMAKSGSTYSFRIDYEGENVVSYDESTGQVSFVPADDNENAAQLPMYDANGNRYLYRVKETVIFPNPGAQSGERTADRVDQVYKIQEDLSSNFTFTNKYQPDKGALKVKKLLSLPADTTADNGGFPKITFCLTRTYTDADGVKVEDENFSRSATINSTDVGTAFEEAVEDAPTDDPVVLEFDALVFENLEIYAPNGSEYLYTVTETRLNGYQTYAKQGDAKKEDFTDDAPITGEIAVTGLKPQQIETPVEEAPEPAKGAAVSGSDITVETAQATFYNVWAVEQETVTLTGTKTWQDFSDAMDTRPTVSWSEGTFIADAARADPLGLKVVRTAGDSKETLTLGEDYTVTYTKNDAANTWTFEIEGVGEGELEKWATSATAWTYTVTEEVEDGKLAETEYRPSTANGQWTPASAGTATDGVVNLKNLTNSLYTQVHFAKKWVDGNGKEITSNHIDLNVKVTFQLQVSDDEGETWENAGTYFTTTVSAAANEIAEEAGVSGGWTKGSTFTATKEGTISGGGWSGSFTNLPRVIKVDEGFKALTYRVVETAVTYGQKGQNFTLEADGSYMIDSSDGGELVTKAEYNFGGTTHTTTNTLSAISVTVEKKWVDNNNQYATRPNSQGGSMTWESWFVLQRRAKGSETWDNVELINLYGTDSSNGNGAPAGERWSETINGLPTMDFTGKGTPEYTYRVRELKPKLENGAVVGYTDADLQSEAFSDQLVEPGGTYAQAGKFDYKAEYSTSDGVVASDSKNVVTVTNRLIITQEEADSVRVVATKQWWPKDSAVERLEVTLQLQYREENGANWQPFASGSNVTLQESNSWIHTWDDLPTSMGGADGPEIIYRVVELTTPGGYVQLPVESSVSTVEDNGKTIAVYAFTVTNVEETSFSVKKEWINPAHTVAEVTVGLYRTTDEDQVGLTTGEQVPESETGSSAQRKETLTADSWSVTFENLPKYNADGDLYYYYALELNGVNPVANHGAIAYGDAKYHVSYGHDYTGETGETTIRNIPSTEITGSKTWVDNSNKYHTRPNAEDFRLNLLRKTDQTTWTPVDLETEGITFGWTVTEKDKWQYAFRNLPLYNADDETYTYMVTETPPPGYMEKYGGAGSVAADGKGPDFTNTLTGSVEIKGTKTWEGGIGSEPVLTLERSLNGTTWDSVPNATAVTWSNKEGNQWTYFFGSHAMYDDNGVRYTYRVREICPDGYDVYYGATSELVLNTTIRNVARGSLTVTKTVTGSRGSRSQAFPFTVTFTLPKDFKAENKPQNISYTMSNGTQGQLSFSEGETTVTFTFHLRHGESITFTDLPGHTAYTVTETNPFGHSQSAANAGGAVPPGGTVTAAFTNYRGGSGGGDDPPPDEPDEPGTDIPDDPTPGEEVPFDPDGDVPRDPEDPGTEIPDDPAPGDDVPADPSLPQTGQLWWPVWLLAAAGVALLLTGVLKGKGTHGKRVKK